MSVAAESRKEPQRDSKFLFSLLCLFFIVEYLRPQDVWPALSTLRPALVVSILLVTGLAYQRRLAGLDDPKIHAVMIFTVLCAIGIFWVPNHRQLFNTTVGMMVVLFGGMLPMIAILQNRLRVRSFFRFWLLLHACLATWGLLISGGTGPGGFVGDENDFALVLNMAIPVAILGAPSLAETRWGRFLCVACALLLGLASISTLSRGGMVGLAAAVMGMVAVSKHKVRHLLVVAVVTLLSMRFVPDIVVSEIATIADPTDDTAVLRFYYWGLAWDMFLDNPIFGIGAANYPWTVQLYEVDSEASILGRSVAGRAAHSLYLTLLAELGLTGTITYVALVLAVLKSLLDNIRALRGYGETEAALIADLSRGMIASLFSFLLCGAFISVLYYPVFWYAVAATVALERRRRSVIAAHLQSAALPDGTVRHGFEGGGERHAFNSAAGARGSY